MPAALQSNVAMKLRVIVVSFLAMSLGAASAQDSYVTEIQQWQKEQEKELRADGGWLTVAGLFWLHSGNNTFGSGKTNEIVLPAPVPEKAGWFTLDKRTVTVSAMPSLNIRLNGQPIATGTSGGVVMKQAALVTNNGGRAGTITLGDLTIFPIARGDRIGIRLKDKNSQARRDFKGMRYYPINPGYRLTADFVPAEKGATLKIPNIIGQINDLPTPGYAEFTLDGKKLRLAPVTEGDCGDGTALTNRGNCRLFFIFKDLTSGHGTYPPGRFLYTGLPENGKLVLDFNRAENPPCAWTAYATCPLPPKENVLSVPVEAGEMFAGHH
jgi:uncharacterized protein